MREFLEELDKISQKLDKNKELESKIFYYIKTLKDIIEKKEYKTLIKLETIFQQERKNIKILTKENFPLFIKYDNIYLEMIKITRHLIKSSRKEIL